MKASILAAASLAALGVSLAAPSFAQQTTPTANEPRWTMPYESKFWGYTGFSLGRSRLHADCPAGANCDDRDNVWKIYGGGKFNDFLGAEVGLMDLGSFDRAGGTTKTRAPGVDLALTAGIPIGGISSVFLKAGTSYNRTEVTGTAPGLQTGRENGWGPRWGIGAQASFTKNWAVRLDADRYRVQLPGTKENIDTFTIGAQYSFR